MKARDWAPRGVPSNEFAGQPWYDLWCLTLLRSAELMKLATPSGHKSCSLG